jgi:hypothetical protein
MNVVQLLFVHVMQLQDQATRQDQDVGLERRAEGKEWRGAWASKQVN